MKHDHHPGKNKHLNRGEGKGISVKGKASYRVMGKDIRVKGKSSSKAWERI